MAGRSRQITEKEKQDVLARQGCVASSTTIRLIPLRTLSSITSIPYSEGGPVNDRQHRWGLQEAQP